MNFHFCFKKRSHLLVILLLCDAAQLLPAAKAATAVATFGLNDVSILLPLPVPQEISALLSPQDAGGRGTLIPKEIYARFPALDNRFDAQSLYVNNFKVIGIRLDPCFAEGTSTTCRRQIRLVWQPLIEVSGRTTTLDAAIHAFYEFSETEWSTVLRNWQSFAQGNLAESLQVNPQINREGFSGHGWMTLKQIILASCGAKNLVRVTGMRVSAARMWSFLGFDRTDAGWTQMNIPRTNSTLQSFILFSDSMLDLSEFQGTLSPPPSGENLFLELITNSKDFKRRRTESDVKLVMQKAIQMENPKLHNPGTVDCVSCHMAQTVSLWGQQNFPAWDWQNAFARERYVSLLSLKNNSQNPANANRVRAFGYFEAEPIFSQRVINETAEVSTRLSKSF